MTQPPQSSSGPLSPQNSAYGQGGMPAPGSPSPQGATPAPAKKPSKAPKVLIILGSVILALGVIVGIVLAVVGLGGAFSTIDELEVFDSGSGTVTAEADEMLMVYVEEGTPIPSCTIDGPAVGAGTLQTSTLGNGERQWRSVDSFTAEEAGEYDISCGDTPIAVGPPVSMGGVLVGIGGIFVAIAGGGLGFLLLVLGVILLIVRKRSA
ncbi:MAG: hypothetical protein ACTHX0_12745 [Brachybacterium sp.]